MNRYTVDVGEQTHSVLCRYRVLQTVFHRKIQLSMFSESTASDGALNGTSFAQFWFKGGSSEPLFTAGVFKEHITQVAAGLIAMDSKLAQSLKL